MIKIKTKENTRSPETYSNGAFLWSTQEDLYATSSKRKPGPIVLQRQHSSPQLFSSSRTSTEQKPWEFAARSQPPVQASPGNTTNNTSVASADSKQEERLPFTPRGPPPPKPPRITNSLKKAAAAQAAQAALEAQIRANEQRWVAGEDFDGTLHLS